MESNAYQTEKPTFDVLKFKYDSESFLFLSFSLFVCLFVFFSIHGFWGLRDNGVAGKICNFDLEVSKSC